MLRTRDFAAALRDGVRGIFTHDEVTMTGVGGEQPMTPDEVGARSRHEGGQTRDEVVRFEHHVRGAIGKLPDYIDNTVDIKAWTE